MALPFRFGDLTLRFANVRPWADAAVGSQLNRCAVCMAYTLQLAPSAGDASIADIPGVKSTFTAAGPVKYGPSPASPAFGGTPDTPYGSYFFIRAAELLPRVQRAFGQADVRGPSNTVWPKVQGRKGVIYLEHSYQTEGDKKWSLIPWLYAPMSGGHWDLFDGFVMVAEKHPIADNTHEGDMHFWLAR
jgi:hypothetical protein